MAKDDSWLSIAVDTDGDNDKDVIGRAAGPVAGVLIIIAVITIVDIMVNQGQVTSQFLELIGQ